MTTTDIELPSDKAALARADFISQTTAVEQARAVAEVQAAIVVARNFPRDLAAATAEMRESCTQLALAERSFYRYPRGGSTISGESVHLARELARCFGNVQYGINELRRDDDGHYSELQAWAWDVERNTRSSTTFVAPHKRDKRGGAEVLVDMRDIYESNSNQGARRLREAIFSILPVWFKEEAKRICTETLTAGVSGKALPQAVADAVSKFEQEHGVTLGRLEAKVGRKRGEWTAHDVAQLRVSFKSLHEGTVTVEDEFPSNRVTAAEITAGTPSSETAKAEPAPSGKPALDEDTTWVDDAKGSKK